MPLVLAWIVEAASGEQERAAELARNIVQADPSDGGRSFVLHNSICYLDKVEYAAMLLQSGKHRVAERMLADGKTLATTIFDQGMRNPGIYCVLAKIAALEGNEELALDYLETAVQSGFGAIEQLEVSPALHSLRDNPKYTSILNLIKARGQLELEKIRTLDWSRFEDA